MSTINLLLYGFALLVLLFAIGHVRAGRRHFRQRHHARGVHRLLWAVIFFLLAIGSAGLGTALIGYHRLVEETPVAKIDVRQIDAQHFALVLELPDGRSEQADLRGDEWQIDARVIKWQPRAVMLGAQPLYRLERISGRYRDIAQTTSTTPTAQALSTDNIVDLWQLKKRFPQWLPWIDAEYGSAAYLPLLDGTSYQVSLSPLGGLIARPADGASAEKLHAAGW